MNIEKTNIEGAYIIQNNYADKYLSYNTNIDFEKQNRLIGEKIIKFQKDLSINFLTKSYYKK